MVVELNLNVYCSHSAVHDGEWGERRGGFLLKSTIISTVLRVFSSRLLRLQLLHFLSVSRLVSILEEADDSSVVCKLQELDRGVL